jgi:hypothetical protein
MFDESTARVVVLDRRCIDRQSIPYAMLVILNDTALCPLPGMHVNLSRRASALKMQAYPGWW